MRLDPERRFPVMCLTQDGTGIPHSVQAERLCAAGARWIQLRMKGADRPRWLDEAIAAADACRRHDALLIINDSVEIALECGAAGAHLGSDDGEWAQARHALGPGRILGGTVNNSADALRAAASGCLDYAGVGPLRFTATKQRLSPVLGLDGVRRLVSELRGLPAWVIGGVTPSDVPALRGTGAAGVAVSSALHRGGLLAENLGAFLDAWPFHAPASLP